LLGEGKKRDKERNGQGKARSENEKTWLSKLRVLGTEKPITANALKTI
jgi:hypothetical protein